MDFSFTKDQKFFMDYVRRTLQRLVVPHAGAIDRDDRFPLYGNGISEILKTIIARDTIRNPDSWD
jgi:hypothetical protein